MADPALEQSVDDEKRILGEAVSEEIRGIRETITGVVIVAEEIYRQFELCPPLVWPTTYKELREMLILDLERTGKARYAIKDYKRKHPKQSLNQLAI